jgi:hypothetical protein
MLLGHRARAPPRCSIWPHTDATRQRKNDLSYRVVGKTKAAGPRVRRARSAPAAPRSAFPSTCEPIPDEVVAAAEALKDQFSGVVGVFWGHGTSKGVRHSDKRLCVHVRWKRPEEDPSAREMISSRWRGIPTDITEVGRPRAHALDFTDDLFGRSGKTRRGAIAGIASDDLHGALALVSGHVTLPLRDGKIVRSYAGGESAEVRVVETGGNIFDGDVVRGQLGGAVDFALVRFAGAKGDAVNTHHAVAGRTPFIARSIALIDGENLHHFSALPNRRKPIFGQYDQAAATPVEFTLPDERDATYESLIAVRSTDTLPFSLEGDSGSLVVDDGPRVVGMVLGASSDFKIGYVLPVSALIDNLGSDAKSFFR